MRYYLDTTTLFIRGAFRAASTGINGGIRTVSTLLNHTVPDGWSDKEPVKELDRVVAGAGIGSDFFGLLTAVPMANLCVLQYDFITVFVTAGINQKPDTGAGTINIIVFSNEGIADPALLELLMVTTEAKAEALLAMGRTVTGTPTDAVITACEGDSKYIYAGRITGPGQRVREAVLKGVPEALHRFEERQTHNEPAFFIFSRFNGEHWVTWTPHDCPYYPCHFPGQTCDFCYCPFYPCRNEQLGEWTTRSGNGRIWNCARCTLLHEPSVADYLKKYPEAALEELQRVKTNSKKVIP